MEASREECRELIADNTQVNAVGIISKRGNDGGTSAHLVIACDFLMWLSAELRLHLLETMHMLKRL